MQLLLLDGRALVKFARQTCYVLAGLVAFAFCDFRS
jgi:hypothetical protein